MNIQSHFHRIDNKSYGYAENWETNSWGKIGMLSTGVKIWASGVKLSLEDEKKECTGRGNSIWKFWKTRLIQETSACAAVFLIKYKVFLLPSILLSSCLPIWISFCLYFIFMSFSYYNFQLNHFYFIPFYTFIEIKLTYYVFSFQNIQFNHFQYLHKTVRWPPF